MSRSPSQSRHSITALPVFNEVGHVAEVLAEVCRFSSAVLVIDDGSTDGTDQLLKEIEGIELIRHASNRGYGAALRSAFAYAQEHQYEVVVTVDCDGQHEPARIPALITACESADIVSGSRYLEEFPDDIEAPQARRDINHRVTAELNSRLGLQLTDAFCGFKAYRVAALKKLRLTEDGYGMPLELWAEAAKAQLSIHEIPVPLIYLDESRSFGGALDDSVTRLKYYRQVLDRAMARTDEGRTCSACGDSAG